MTAVKAVVEAGSEYTFPPGNRYSGTLTRYTKNRKAYALRAMHHEQLVRIDRAKWLTWSFERWLDEVVVLARQLRQQYVVPFLIGNVMAWKWNADLHFVIASTNDEWTRKPQPVEWGFGGSPTRSLSSWVLPKIGSARALVRRAHWHLQSGRVDLFYRDLVGSHFLTRGNAGVATVLANALGERRVRAEERLDLVAMAGSTNDFRRAWGKHFTDDDFAVFGGTVIDSRTGKPPQST